jgi:hypothetical protein
MDCLGLMARQEEPGRTVYLDLREFVGKKADAAQVDVLVLLDLTAH